MRVAVNARRLSGQRLGVGRYIEYLLEHWSRLRSPDDDICAYLREPLPADSRLARTVPETEVLRPRLTGVTWENLVLSRRARADVLFCPSYTAPASYRGASVVAIHSTNEIALDAHERSYRFTYGALYRMSARKATRVIVPSRSTRTDLCTHYGIDEAKVDVIPQGVDDDVFRPLDDEPALRAVRERYFGANRPYIVFVGKLSRRRNIPLLLEAFARLRHQAGVPHGLLLVGPNHDDLPLKRLAHEHGLNGDVVQTDGRFAEHQQLVEIYCAADLYVNASLYEGFSMTLVEALACGVPVLAAARGALPEIAGDAALLIDEPNLEAVSKGLERALLDQPLRAGLRERGPLRARAFRWEDTARETWRTLRQAASERA
jgi:glycosyltransferase involved in cell wall biosynthesis